MGIGRQSVCLSGCCLAGAGGRRAAAEFKEPLRDLGGFWVRCDSAKMSVVASVRPIFGQFGHRGQKERTAGVEQVADVGDLDHPNVRFLASRTRTSDPHLPFAPAYTLPESGRLMTKS